MSDSCIPNMVEENKVNQDWINYIPALSLWWQSVEPEAHELWLCLLCFHINISASTFAGGKGGGEEKSAFLS